MYVCVLTTIVLCQYKNLEEGGRGVERGGEERSNVSRSWNSVVSARWPGKASCMQDSECLCLDHPVSRFLLLPQPKEVFFFPHSLPSPWISTAQTSIKTSKLLNGAKSHHREELFWGSLGFSESKKCSWLWVAIYWTAINLRGSSHRTPFPKKPSFWGMGWSRKMNHLKVSAI